MPFQNRKSVRPWLGIKPTFGPETAVQSPGLFGFRFMMVMTYIVLKADGATSRSLERNLSTTVKVDKLIRFPGKDGFGRARSAVDKLPFRRKIRRILYPSAL